VSTGRTFARYFVWAVVGGLAGIAAGFAVGVYWVSRIDCSPHPIGCEGTAYIPVVCGFWGFWVGIVVGIASCVIYTAKKGPPAADVPPVP
jgi:hypothetical protein